MYGTDIPLFPEKRCNVADRISPEIVVLGGNQKGDGVGAFGTEPLSDSIGSIAELFYGGFDESLIFQKYIFMIQILRDSRYCQASVPGNIGDRNFPVKSSFSYAGFLDPLVSSYHRTSSPTISRMRNAGIFFIKRNVFYYEKNNTAIYIKNR